MQKVITTLKYKLAYKSMLRKLECEISKGKGMCVKPKWMKIEDYRDLMAYQKRLKR